MFRKRAVFLDRDGTLLKAIYRPELNRSTAPFKYEELEFAPNIDAALAVLKQSGYLLIIVTNQPDVIYGYVTKDEWEKIQQAVLDRVKPDDCFMCRHPKGTDCWLRKPAPGMLLAAADKWGIDLKQSFMVGDMEFDMEAGKKAGCATILLLQDYNQDVQADYRVGGLWSAAYLISHWSLVISH